MGGRCHGFVDAVGNGWLTTDVLATEHVGTANPKLKENGVGRAIDVIDELIIRDKTLLFSK